MAFIETEIKAKLQSNNTLTSLVSNRIYYLKAENTSILPYIVYAVVSNPDDRKYIGKDYSSPRFQFDIVAANPINALTIENALRSVLYEFTGTLTTLVVDRIKPVSRRDFMDLDDHVVIQLDFIVEYRRV